MKGNVRYHYGDSPSKQSGIHRSGLGPRCDHCLLCEYRMGQIQGKSNWKLIVLFYGFLKNWYHSIAEAKPSERTENTEAEGATGAVGGLQEPL